MDTVNEVLFILLLITLVYNNMGKKSKRSKRGRQQGGGQIPPREEKARKETRERVESYIKEFPMYCENKRLADIIEEFANISNEKPRHFRRQYTQLELNEIYHKPKNQEDANL